MTRTDEGKWYTVLEVMEMDTDVIAFCILFVAWLVISFFTHDYAKALLYLVLFIFLIEWVVGLLLTVVVAIYTPWIFAGTVILIIILLKKYHVF